MSAPVPDLPSTWAVWDPRTPLVIDQRAGIFRYERHEVDEYGRELVLVFGGNPGRFYLFPPERVRPADPVEQTMVRAAHERAAVATPRGAGQLMYWTVTGRRCRVQLRSGEIRAFDKADVTLVTNV